MIDVRQKGAQGEREICDWFNGRVFLALKEMSEQYPSKPPFQRNQNQSAVGGSDITNAFGLCLEVKRQETLCIPQWWTQCTEASHNFGGIPILLFRQNGKRKWNIMMEVHVPSYMTGHSYLQAPAILEQSVFEQWLDNYIRAKIRLGVFDGTKSFIS